jgi:hypothetical protein
MASAKTSVLFGVLLIGLFVLFSGARPAYAHPGHEHAHVIAVAPHAAMQTVVVDRETITPEPRAAELTEAQTNERVVHVTNTPSWPALPFQEAKCCCGSIACHMGVTASAEPVTHCDRLGARVELLVVLPVAGTRPGGIERPPRSISA